MKRTVISAKRGGSGAIHGEQAPAGRSAAVVETEEEEEEKAEEEEEEVDLESITEVDARERERAKERDATVQALKQKQLRAARMRSRNNPNGFGLRVQMWASSHRVALSAPSSSVFLQHRRRNGAPCRRHRAGVSGRPEAEQGCFGHASKLRCHTGRPCSGCQQTPDEGRRATCAEARPSRRVA